MAEQGVPATTAAYNCWLQACAHAKVSIADVVALALTPIMLIDMPTKVVGRGPDAGRPTAGSGARRN